MPGRSRRASRRGARGGPAKKPSLSEINLEHLDFLAGLEPGERARLAARLETLQMKRGDVLMLVTDCLADGSRPLARAGDHVEIRAPGFAPLVHTLVRETA